MDCYHCGLPITAGDGLIYLEIDQISRAMCCQGCAAVAKAIIGAGLIDYYRKRTEMAPTMRKILPEELSDTAVYDQPAVVSKYVTESNQVGEATLLLDNVNCAACVWLVQQQLRRLPGVLEVQANYTTHRAWIRWDLNQHSLGALIAAIRSTGYSAHPYEPGRHQQLLETQRKHLLRRLGVAAAFGMQVMILSIALYAGAFSGIEQEFKEFFRRLGLLLTLPVVFYSAQPFYLGALRDIRNLKPGMDVPITLGILIAFTGSMYGTIVDEEVYFDSIVMFIGFLLTARYFELMARKRTISTVDNLTQSLPISATRLIPEENQVHHRTVAAAELKVGDLFLVRPGGNCRRGR